MSLLKNVRLREAARSLLDVDIPDSSWKPDFDIADRYQGFANEIMRISLLGITGYGIFIQEVCMKDAHNKQWLSTSKYIICFGAFSLVAALILVLAHRFFSTACLYHQILIMRSLKRIENFNWTDEEKEKEKIFLKIARTVQRTKSKVSAIILMLASIFFGLGFLFMVIVFYKFLSSI